MTSSVKFENNSANVLVFHRRVIIKTLSLIKCFYKNNCLYETFAEIYRSIGGVLLQKNVFLEISQNSQESACASASNLINL